MTVEQTGMLLRLAVGLLALIGVLHFMVRPTVVALFRYVVISERRRLFLLMADGRIHPQSLAYLRLRASLNGMLRHAEKLALLNLVLSGLVLRKRPGPPFSTLDMVRGIEDEELRKECLSIMTTTSIAMTLLCVARAPLMWPFLFVAFVGAFVGVGVREVVEALRTRKQSEPSKGVKELLAQPSESIAEILAASEYDGSPRVTNEPTLAC